MIEIYGKPGCGNCDKAKVKLHRKKIEYSYIELTDEKLSQLQEKFGSKMSRSLPIIVKGDDVFTFDDLPTLMG